MAYFRAAFDTTASPDAAFAYLADFSTTVEWDPGVVSAERIDPLPLGVGTRFEVVSSFLGQRVPLRYEIVQYDAPKRVVLEASTEALRSIDTITCEPIAGGTRVTYDASLILEGWRYVADLGLHAMFQVIGQRALAGLRRELGRGRAAPR